MSTGIISIGVTGMQAAQLGLMTTEHNITNANTPGFSRQRTIQASNIPVMTGAGAIGQGTHVSTIERMYSQFLSNQVNTSQTNVSSLDTYYAEIKQIDDMLADTNSGLSPALQDFFKGVQQVAANPSSISSRQAMVSSAQSLVSRFQSIQDRISQMYDGVNSQITSTVSEINSYAKQIADLNSRIIVAQSSTAQPANDLLDQRDQLVAELNKLVKVDTSANSDGSYNVFIGTGQQLVVGTQASQLAAIASSADPTRIVVGMQTSGFTQEMPESLITGGQLGGLMQFRSESLDRAFNEMGRVAASVALTVDAQHGLGQDLLGQSAGSSGFIANFFDMTNMQPKVTKNAYNTGNAVFQASFAAPSIAGAYTLSNSGGTYTLTRQSDGQSWSAGSMGALNSAVPSTEGVDLTNAVVGVGGSTTVYNASAASANFYTKLTVSDYRLSYDGTNYTMTRLSDNKSWSNTSLSNLSTTLSNSEGFSFTLNAGAMNANDTFLFQPTKGAAANMKVNANVAADPRLIAAGMPFRTGAALSNTGSGTIDNGTTLPGYSSSSLPATGVSISYSGGNLTFTGVPAGANITVTTPGGTSNVYAGPTVPYTSGATISFSGISFQISGVPATGDTFTVGQNTTATGVADGRNAVRLGKLQTQNTAVGGSASFQTTYSQFVSYVGNKTRETKVNGDAQQALLEQAQSSQQALSGVNLDEEAANLLRYQQAYQAAAKMIDVGSKLFDTVLSIGA